MPIPGAATVIATVVLFFHEIGIYTAQKNVFILILTFCLALLMVSTLKFHGLKEIDFSRRKPFWILVVFVFGVVIVVIHPPIALFAFAMVYLAEGIIENTYMFYRKQKKRSLEVKL